MRAPPKRAGIYCRLSYAEDGSEEKVDRQEGDCRKVGDRMVWPISEYHVFKDNNKSAWRRNRNRPGWDAMLRAIELGEIDAIIVYHGDRLIRQPYDLEKLINVADSKGVRIASATGTRDLDNPDDRFVLRIEAAQACRESDNTSRRVLRGHEARVARRAPRKGGRRGFGFEPDNRTHRVSEADVLVDAADLVLAGQTNYGVTQWMNSVSTGANGAPWTSSRFTRVMCRPANAGLLRDNDGDLVRGDWDPIIDPETWELVRTILKTRTDDHGVYESSVKYLLSYIARCGYCQAGLTAKRRGGRSEERRIMAYRCTNPVCTNRVSRTAKLLDAYIIGRTVNLLNDPEFLSRLPGVEKNPAVSSEIAALEQRRIKTKKQLENLADFPEIDAAIVARSLGSFERKIAELRGQVAETSRQRLLGRMAGVTRELWDDTPLDVRRSTVRSLFTIDVMRSPARGPGFDPAFVEVRLVDVFE